MRVASASPRCLADAKDENTLPPYYVYQYLRFGSITGVLSVVLVVSTLLFRLKGPLPQLLGGSVAYWARLADMAGDGIHFAESIVVQASGRPRRPTAMRHELPLHPSGFAE